MRRYTAELVATLALVLFVTSFAADAQRPGHVPRIGWLALASPPLIELEGLRLGLRELGYVEGQNIVIEDRYAEGKSERLPDLVAELVRLKVDVLLAAGGAPTRAAKQGTTTTPIVSVSGDPVAAGFVLGLARPGGNITGLTQFTTELSGKRLELLKETLPRLTRVAVLAYTAAPLTDLRTTESAAQALGMQLQRLEIQEPAELEHGLHDHDASAGRRAYCAAESGILCATDTDHRTRGTAPAASNVRRESICGGRWLDELWPERS